MNHRDGPPDPDVALAQVRARMKAERRAIRAHNAAIEREAREAVEQANERRAQVERIKREKLTKRELDARADRRLGKVVDTGIEGAQACRDSVRARLNRQLAKHERLSQEVSRFVEATRHDAVVEFIKGEQKWLAGQAARAAKAQGGVQSTRKRKSTPGGGKAKGAK